ncbi:MAG: hypothetical protein DHS20C08_22440 [Rhodomicrobium sp.]|nr:MAG: hypothetical protein DHS20C08_22440 [Rhodomicrobium sp.]
MIMEALFSAEGLFTLLMLIVLQAVLGFDNLLYISIESKRVAPESQRFVRRLGIGLAILLRVVLLFVILKAVEALQDTLFTLDFTGIATGEFSGHALIVLFGGGFILYTAVKEISHLLAVNNLQGEGSGPKRSVATSVMLIVLMNLVFSFDSILSAMALTKDFWIMAAAVVVSGLLMIWLADHIAEFLERNRMYEVLGLFILFIVGVLLVSEGGELAKLSFFGYEVHAMAKSTFYFVLAVLIVVEVIQSQYKKRLMTMELSNTTKT